MKTVIQSAQPSYSNVVRVAVSDNFNCTKAEYHQLAQYVKENPGKFFFVNSNVKTPLLLTLNDHPYKAVVTVNPDLTVRERDTLKFLGLKKDVVAFARVKYLPDNQEIMGLIKRLSAEGYSTVITSQRFNGKDTLLKYTSLDHYHFECSRYRLNETAFKTLCSFADSTPSTFICDRQGMGCSACGLCSSLTAGTSLKLYSLNLSTSGVCKFNCPDCYAKSMQRFLARIGMPIIRFDKIQRNAKQSGRTQHIKLAKAAQAV